MGEEDQRQTRTRQQHSLNSERLAEFLAQILLPEIDLLMRQMEVSVLPKTDLRVKLADLHACVFALFRTHQIS